MIETIQFDTDVKELPGLLEELAYLHGKALLVLTVLPASPQGTYHVLITVKTKKK